MNKNLLIALGVLAALILAGLYFNVVSAGGNSNTNITNNYYPSSMTIVEGVSDEDLAEGLTAAFANSHQFDFSTHLWQGSVVGAFESEESENAVSFGVGKRFKKLDALIHGSFTQTGGDTQYYVIGTTFRF